MPGHWKGNIQTRRRVNNKWFTSYILSSNWWRRLTAPRTTYQPPVSRHHWGLFLSLWRVVTASHGGWWLPRATVLEPGPIFTAPARGRAARGQQGSPSPKHQAPPWGQARTCAWGWARQDRAVAVGEQVTSSAVAGADSPWGLRWGPGPQAGWEEAPGPWQELLLVTVKKALRARPDCSGSLPRHMLTFRGKLPAQHVLRSVLP